MIALVAHHLGTLLAALVQLRGDGIGFLWVGTGRLVFDKLENFISS